MEGWIVVTVTSPVMVGPGHARPGDRVEVTLAEAAQLEAMGVIEPIALGVSVADLAPGAPGFDEAVAAAAKELAAQAFDGALAELEAEAKQIAADAEGLEAERDAALARAVEAEAQRDLLQSQVLELRMKLTDASAAALAETIERIETEDAPPKAPKKAAAAKKKG